MCELSILVATKASKGVGLSPVEQVIDDIMWVDIQVNANGFDGWLYNNTSARMARTVDALFLAGCSTVAGIVARALSVVGLDPWTTSDSVREALLNSLKDNHRGRLSSSDGEYYDAAEGCMEACRQFVVSHRVQFCFDETAA